MLETLDDGINVTRIFKKVQPIKMKRFFEVFGASNLPSQEITKENVIHLLYRTHTHKNTRLRTETARFIVENDDDDDEAFFIFIIPGIIYSREQ
jgi:hypothetical protein